MRATTTTSRPASAPSRRGKGVAYPANAQRRAGNSFAQKEITILRDAQQTQYLGGVGRTRTVSASYMSSSDWSKGAEAGVPLDYTTIPDRPFGTNKNDDSIMNLAEQLGIAAHEHQHSAGMLGLERSRAAFAAVRQRFDECENEQNIRWFEGHSFHTSGLPGSKDQPILYSQSGKVKNRTLQYSDVLRDFETRVQRGRSFSSTQSLNLSDFMSDYMDDMLDVTRTSASGRVRKDSSTIHIEQSRDTSTQTPTGYIFSCCSSSLLFLSSTFQYGCM